MLSAQLRTKVVVDHVGLLQQQASWKPHITLRRMNMFRFLNSKWSIVLMETTVIEVAVVASLPLPFYTPIIIH